MIPDNIRLLGLIVNTKPYTYVGNTVDCTYSTYIEVNDLRELKTSIETEKENGSYSDDKLREYNDDIFFLDTLITNLENA
jgi:hypothetical protein